MYTPKGENVPVTEALAKSDRTCCGLCYGPGLIIDRVKATLDWALRLQVWRPRTRLRLIRLQMRWNRDVVPNAEA